MFNLANSSESKNMQPELKVNVLMVDDIQKICYSGGYLG